MIQDNKTQVTINLDGSKLMILISDLREGEQLPSQSCYCNEISFKSKW